MKRLVSVVSVAALVLGVVGLVPAAATAAVPVSSSSIRDGAGAILTSLGTGDTASLRTDAPVTVPGTSTQQITQRFDPAKVAVLGHSVSDGQGGTVTVPDVTIPEGYTPEYYDGSTWSADPPAYDGGTNTYPDLAGVRASGALTTTLYSSGIGHFESTAASNPVGVAGFQGSSGGDGWNVFFGSGPAAGRVFNIYHHSNGSLGVDCHTQSDGAACWDGAYFAAAGSRFSTSAHSTGFYQASSDSIFTFVADSQTGALGMACITDVSTSIPTDCTTPFVALTGDVGASYTQAGDAVLVGGLIYARGTIVGQDMLCFDPSTATPCNAEPYSIGAPDGDGQFGDNRLLTDGTDVYFSTGTVLGCFDTVTLAQCTGFNSGGPVSVGNPGPLFLSTDTAGTATQICAYSAGSCWTLSGSPGIWPDGLPTGVQSSAIDGWGDFLRIGPRLLYWNGDSPECYSFLTSTACEGYTAPTMGSYAYAMSADPLNARCVWSNSDAGQIKTFDPVTGATPCPSAIPAVAFPYTSTVPRLSCAETSRVVTWGRFVLTPGPDGSISQARVSVLDSNGSAIAGWQDKTLTQLGELDLSTLTVGQTGLHPTFQVHDADNSDPAGASALVAYTGSEPQVCTNVTALQVACPLGQGPGSSDFPQTSSAASLTSAVRLVTNGGTPNTESTTASATGVGDFTASQCLTVVDGYVFRHRDGTNPVAGMTVLLIDPTSRHTLATATTDLTGHYAFTGTYPNTYYAAADGVSTVSTAIPYNGGDATAMPDLVLPATAPTLALMTPTVRVGTSKTVLIGAGVPASVLEVAGGCSVTSAVVTFSGVGPCRISVVQEGVVLQRFTVVVTAPPTIVAPPATTPPGTSFRYLGSPGIPAANAVVSGPCVSLAGVVYFAYPGTCRITVKQSGATVQTLTTKVVEGAELPAGASRMSMAKVFFGPASSKLTATAKAKLTTLVPTLRAAKVTLVIGYTTSTSSAGPGSAAALLSKARATAVANYLTARGVHVTLKAGVGRLGNPAIGAATNRRADIYWTGHAA